MHNIAINHRTFGAGLKTAARFLAGYGGRYVSIRNINMNKFLKALIMAICFLPFAASASDGYKITGKSGIMYFVSVDKKQAANEDVYRLAVGEACAGKSICQVQYWIGSAPKGFPLSDAQVKSKVVQWQQNFNTGLRRWLVNCKSSKLFSKERQCM